MLLTVCLVTYNRAPYVLAKCDIAIAGAETNRGRMEFGSVIARGKKMH